MSGFGIAVVALIVGGVVSTAVGAALMDVSDGASYVLTRGGVAACVMGVVIAVFRVAVG